MPILSAHVIYHQALGAFIPLISEHVPAAVACCLPATQGREPGGEVVLSMVADPVVDLQGLAARRSGREGEIA